MIQPARRLTLSAAAGALAAIPALVSATPPATPAPGRAAATAHTTTRSDSTPAPGRTENAPTASSPLPLLHVLDADGLRVVLLDAAEPAWGRGAPALVSSGHPAAARRAVDPRALPAHLAARAGERVRLLDARGVRCEATLGDFALVGRAEVHFGMRAAWTGDDGSPDRARPMTPAQIAADLWSLDDALGVALTASVRPVQGDCAGARWALPAAAPRPAFGSIEPADDATRARALASFRALPAWRAAQRSYRTGEAAGRRVARWDEHGGARPEVLVVRTPDGASRVWVAAHVSAGGCGEFDAHVSALFDAAPSSSSPARAWTPLYNSTDRQVRTPRAALVPPGGAVELLFDEARLTPASDGYRFEALAVPFLDCTC